VPPFVIFSDRSLHEMCRCYPSTLPEMRRINGVGDVKLERYGDDFVGVVQTYLEAHPEVSKSLHSPSASFDHPVRSRPGVLN